ncbi:MAG: type II toxin-antitoxin system VapC family toxin [Spirochaetaceae bacterium]|nr:type II toxin-antitoxin system VapC family toxin [Spirochaetaceae bacterium]
MIYVLDACALIAFLNEERGSGFETVDNLFVRAGAGEISLCMNAVNLVEVYYNFIRSDGQTVADEIMRGIDALPIEYITDMDSGIRSEAARFKACYPMSLADAFLCATAKSCSAAAVTKDTEIEAAEQSENISVLWIDRP